MIPKPFICYFAIVAFTFTLGSAQRCASRGVFNYLSCDQSCTPISSNLSLSLIRRCTSLAPFGCKLRTCDGGYECVGTSDRNIQTCANSKVVFHEGNPAKTDFQFTLDLNTPPLAGDYYFLINARSKMRIRIPDVIESILGFIDSVNGNKKIRFGLGIYRNEDQLDMGFLNLKNLTRNHDVIRRAVNRIDTKTSRGAPDALLQALVKASKQQFRPTADKAIFAFGDTPGHEPSQVDDGEALERTSVAYKLRDANISFVAINYRDLGMNGGTRSFGISPEVRTMGNQANFIARETDGVVVFRDSAFNAFWRSKTGTDRQFKILPFTCSKFIDVVAGNATFPVVIEQGKPAVVPLTLRFKDGFCTPFTCQFRVIEDDTELQRFTIEVPPSTSSSTC